MSTDEWFEYDGTELVNLSRTAQLAAALGITTVWQRPEDVAWVPTALLGANAGGFGWGGFGGGEFGVGGFSYGDIAMAPWYDAGVPASTEFAGAVPLSVQGLDDSTRASTITEYITDGGNSGRGRNATLTVVFSLALVASTARGAEFGKRWLDRVLRGTESVTACAGTDLRYFRYGAADSPVVRRRDVSLTRGVSVTRKRTKDCSSTWTVTFTLTAADPYEYGEDVPKVNAIGGAVASGPGVTNSGSLALVQESCPAYDYSPIYDPLYPALVPAPPPPNFLPAGWDISTGDAFMRYWAWITPVEPSALNTVPIFRLTTTEDARMVRVSVWTSDTALNDQCGPLFSAVISYLPANLPFYIDGSQNAAYVWDGYAPVVRRTDSLVYAPDGNPVQWPAFNDHTQMLVTLDVFAADGGGYQGGGNVRASLALVPKSD